jgi:hypothetical protein
MMPRRNVVIDETDEYGDSGLNMNAPASQGDLSAFDAPLDDLSNLSQDALPFDRYLCVFKKVEPKTTTTGHPRINIQWQVIDGDYAKRVLFDGANITPDSLWVVAARGKAIDPEGWEAFETEMREAKAAGHAKTPRDIANWFVQRAGSAQAQVEIGPVKKPNPNFKKDYDVVAVRAAA